jgi:8-oxo-dGTP pyrophosphatase MutT (NUDIX family)
VKIDFPVPHDGVRHNYCLTCRSENVKGIITEGKSQYRCLDCGLDSPRIICFDPALVWWIDENSLELWHESIGVFVFNRKGRILLFERVIYPYVFTIPAGHLEKGESLSEAALREVKEETGLQLDSLELVAEEDFVGDSCKWGADNHRWHLYKAIVDLLVKVDINEEGHTPRWVEIDEALKMELTVPTRYFIHKYFL